MPYSVSEINILLVAYMLSVVGIGAERQAKCLIIVLRSEHLITFKRRRNASNL